MIHPNFLIVIHSLFIQLILIKNLSFSYQQIAIIKPPTIQS